MLNFITSLFCFPQDEISSPVGAHLEFSESELFPEIDHNNQSEPVFSDPSSPSFSLSDHPLYFNSEDNFDNSQHVSLFSPGFENNTRISLGNEDFGQLYNPSHNNIYAPSSYGLSPPFSFDGLFMGNEHHHQEMEFQPLSCEGQQHLIHGPASEILSLDDPNFTVPKLSAEERKMKIHRYLKKRNQRNFSKKIKYACRKTLADSRPRVRGRFAKNDELAEIVRTANGMNNREDEADDDFRYFSNPVADRQGSKAVKEEDDLESSDIFAHISGVNSLKCNYPIQSWI